MRDRLKRWVARAGRNRTFRRRLPADLGGCWFPASVEGGAKFLRRDLHRADPMLTRFAQDYVSRGSIVWDVGANVGLFTFVAAGLAAPTGQVLAIEADEWLAMNLRRAARWNTGTGVTVDAICVAISDTPGVSEFNVARANRAVSYLTSGGGSTMTGGVRSRHHVPTLPLDALLGTFPAPNIVKIDVEGHEVAVLTGARRVLDSQPVILVEVQGRNTEQVQEFFSTRSYQCLDAVTRGPTTLHTDNIIAVPAVSALTRS